MTAAKGFPAFAPQGAGARFATSWWGRAWLKALEDTSLDHTLLAKGRAYAKTGQLGPITVSAGRIAVVAEGEYTAAVHVAPVTPAFVEQIAAKAGHLAALLDGDLPYDLVELLPGVGDLEPECDCPDWGHPCKHAAALCYQASWLLDRDPFLLMLMRGLDKDDLIASLQRATAPTGTPVAEAYAHGTPPLPSFTIRSSDPFGAEHAVAEPLEVEPAPGIDPAALRVLAADAALRARELLVSGAAAVLTEFQDRVRLAATHDLDIGLPAAVQSWRYGGADALDTLTTAWTPPKQAVARAGWQLPGFEVSRNRWSLGGVQVRYGRDGRWYPFVDADGDWFPAGPPEPDPATALATVQGTD
ncbi:SWIM zinc finger family protein [Nonomuraea mangrovi]|uniref:SWIM zinc finger family protein n=1 Tax=Nonomuraea mangrovi TaxID=2316207 RepID=A0ABW4STK3_9ACTN